LDSLDVRPGTQLANIGNMSDVQLSRMRRNAFGAAQSSPQRQLLNAVQERLPQWGVEYGRFTESLVQM
jgi:hypothetical protein